MFIVWQEREIETWTAANTEGSEFTNNRVLLIDLCYPKADLADIHLHFYTSGITWSWFVTDLFLGLNCIMSPWYIQTLATGFLCLQDSCLNLWQFLNNKQKAFWKRQADFAIDLCNPSIWGNFTIQSQSSTSIMPVIKSHRACQIQRLVTHSPGWNMIRLGN